MQNSLVSVITPVFNSENFLTQTIESVLGQSHKNIEYILVDDGSTDRSAQIIADYCAKDSRVKLIQLDQNQGISHARNSAIDAANGDFIAFIDSDDIWHKDKLERQLATFSENPKAGLVSTYARNFHADDESLSWQSTGQQTSLNKKISLFDFIKTTPYIYTSSVMVRRQALKKAGGFNPNYKVGEDYALWLNIIQHYEISFVPQCLLNRRLHSQNTSSDRILSRVSKIAILENEALHHRSLSAGQQRWLRLNLQRRYCSLAKIYAKQGKKQQANELFDKAIAVSRFNLIGLKAALFRKLYRT